MENENKVDEVFSSEDDPTGIWKKMLKKAVLPKKKKDTK